jgi:uncharacterized protein DUF6941
MKLDFFMLADGASSPDGKAYIHGGAITRVYPMSFPAPTMLTAVMRFLVDPDEVGGPTRTVFIEWSTPERPSSWVPVVTGDVAPQIPEGVGFREGEDLGMLIVAHMVIGFENPGSHHVRLRLDTDVVCERRLYVIALDDPARPHETRPPAAGN